MFDVTAVEIELKFQVPAAARAAVLRALAGPGLQTLPLRALYVDTADERLAAAQMALRLRREGRAWVQTLKGRGDGLMARLEHEVTLPSRGTPAIDAARHAGSAAGERLAALLADGAPLVERYRTEIRRTRRRLRSGGAVIELAFDEGRIVAGERSLAVCELEFELIGGAPAALLALAERWVRRHGLWLDVRTKSERGQRLARGLAGVPATSAVPAVLPRGADSAAAFVAMLHAALTQALPNAAELADGQGGIEHRHQLRVALRRLRTALRDFAPWSADAAAAQDLERRWRVPFAALGATRDADMLADWLPPAIAAAGGPPLALPPTAAVDSDALLREPAFSVLALQTLRLALQPATAPLPLKPAARELLKSAWQHLHDDLDAFADAAPAERHRLRRRLKRLRYAVEFLLPALPRQAADEALAALRRALEALGAEHDLQVAQARLQPPAGGGDPAVWFAIGWLAALAPERRRRAERRVAALAGLSRFWPRG